jgi:EPS-associated MarR family transcriptional regulator
VSSKAAQEREDLTFRVLRSIEKKPHSSQRSLAEGLGMSLGAINYTLNALIEKGWVKAKNFKNSENRVAYAYILTPQGAQEKAMLTVRFLQRKMREYESLKAEIEELNSDFDPRPRSDNGV